MAEDLPDHGAARTRPTTGDRAAGWLLGSLISATVLLVPAACSTSSGQSTATSAQRSMPNTMGSMSMGSMPSASTSDAADTARAAIGALTITGGYVPQPASPDVAAAYFTVHNSGSRPDTITKVTTNVTSDVMAMTDSDQNGVGSMTDLKQVTVPARGSVELTPGHAHLILEHPTRQVKQGDTVTMTITFATAGTVTLRLPVVSLTGP